MLKPFCQKDLSLVPHLQVLKELLVIYLIAGVVVYLFQRFKIPAVLGLLAAGTLMGPHGLGLVHDMEHVELLAEIGVVLLLFTIGLEITSQKMMGMTPLLIGGGLQVLLTILGFWVAVDRGNASLGAAIFGGFLVTHSSTTIVLKMFMDRGESASPQARIALGILLIQDLSVVWMMVSAPILAGQQTSAWSLFRTVGIAVVVVAGILLFSRYALPRMMYQVVRLRNRELFILSITLVCMGTAWLTAEAGLSLALGAFLAGMALANSEYSHQAMSDVVPFRDSFVSLFFISIGMLFDFSFVLSHPVWIIGAVLGVSLLKFATAAIPTLMIGYPLRTSILVGASLAHLGEFGFVLSGPGRELGLLSAEAYQLFLGTGVITMALSPLLMGLAPMLALQLDRVNWLRRLTRNRHEEELEPEDSGMRDHVVIIGYGFTGRSLTQVLREVFVPYVVLEMNPETVRKARTAGERIFFGDSTREAVMEHLGIRGAKLLVIAISDPSSIRRATQLARRMNPNLHIVVRTRFLTEINELRELGADQIIPEDFETSIEIFSRVLRYYGVSRNIILSLIDQVRGDQYGMLRHVRTNDGASKLHLELGSEIEIETCEIGKDSPAVGKSAIELNLRRVTGATMIAIRRLGILLSNPEPTKKFQVGDVVYLVGTLQQLNMALTLFDPTLTEKQLGVDALTKSTIFKMNPPTPGHTGEIR